MDPLELRPLGTTGLELTRLGFGGGMLGDLWEPISERQAEETVEVACEAGIGYFDTAPFYGHTKSEHRVGRVLRTKPRGSYLLSTKVGRVFFRPADPEGYRPGAWAGGLPFDFRYDYTRDGVLRSYEDSLARLGINRADALLIHDLDLQFVGGEAGVAERFRELDEGGGFAALAELKRHGEIGAVGAGINFTGMIPRFLERFDLDFFIVALPYTLLDQDALADDLPLCAARGAGVVIGAPFASGILARGPRPGAMYGYQPATAAILAKAQRIEAVCARHGVPLGAAALQFPLGHPVVASVIPGANAPEQVRKNLEWLRLDLPRELWAELKAEGLIDDGAPVP